MANVHLLGGSSTDQGTQPLKVLTIILIMSNLKFWCLLGLTYLIFNVTCRFGSILGWLSRWLATSTLPLSAAQIKAVCPSTSTAFT